MLYPASPRHQHRKLLHNFHEAPLLHPEVLWRGRVRRQPSKDPPRRGDRQGARRDQVGDIRGGSGPRQSRLPRGVRRGSRRGGDRGGAPEDRRHRGEDEGDPGHRRTGEDDGPQGPAGVGDAQRARRGRRRTARMRHRGFGMRGDLLAGPARSDRHCRQVPLNDDGRKVQDRHRPALEGPLHKVRRRD